MSQVPHVQNADFYERDHRHHESRLIWKKEGTHFPADASVNGEHVPCDAVTVMYRRYMWDGKKSDGPMHAIDYV